MRSFSPFFFAREEACKAQLKGNQRLPFPVFTLNTVPLCVKHDILATLSYFDIFDYPLTQPEIYQFLKTNYTHSEFVAGLYQLRAESWVYQFEELYSLQDNFSLLPRRRQGNAKARQMLKTAERIASFLSAFPFVRGVAVSGSLSKNFADEQSDIDFFIITASNRLWMARTMLHLFKKITFLFGKQDWFCMNYFVDEDMLQIREKNIYTATEIATLLPLRGIESFRQFFLQNRWTRGFLPNCTMRVSYIEEARGPWIKKIIEFFFSNPFGNLLDFLLMKLTAYRWSKKTKSKKLNRRGVIMSLDATKHYAKPDPENFQNKLVQVYEKKIVNLFRRYQNKAKSIY
jgi:predicted nucleotidyltransferase